MNGGPGTAPDMICGGLGKDTVDYSDKPGRRWTSRSTERCPLIRTSCRVTRLRPSAPPRLPPDDQRHRRPAQRTGLLHNEPSSLRPAMPTSRLHRQRRRRGRARLRRRGRRERRRLSASTTPDRQRARTRIYGQGPRGSSRPVRTSRTGGGGNDLLGRLTGPDVSHGGGAGFDAVFVRGPERTTSPRRSTARANEGQRSRQATPPTTQSGPDHGRRRGPDRR